MLILNNDTEFPADHTFLADREGADTYVLALKATYVVDMDGRCLPLPEQPPIDHAPRYLDPVEPSSLIADTDFDFMKPGTDVTVEGSAVNPDPSGRGEAEVAVAVGPVRKRLRVTGERVWLHSALGPVLSAPAPWREVPVTWERAFGGPDPSRDDGWLEPRNPVGTGIARGQGFEGMRAPQVLAPGERYDGRDAAPAPAGLLPVSRHWEPRKHHAGTYDEAWQRDRAPLWARDLDPRYFMAAPADQQCPTPLRGDEEVRVAGMSHGGPLGFRLPSFRPYMDVTVGRVTHQLRLRVSTVAIRPTLRQVSVSWIAALPCQGDRERILSTEVWDKPLVRLPSGSGEEAA